MDDGQRRQINDLSERLHAQLNIIEQHRLADASEEDLTKTVGTPATYAAGLRKYVETFSGSRRSNDFNRAVTELPLWEGVAAWNQLSLDWRQVKLASLQPHDAEGWIGRIESAIKAYPGFLQQPRFEERLLNLKGIVRRGDAQGSALVKDLQTMLSNRVIVGLWMLQLKDGKQYYFNEKWPEAGAEKGAVPGKEDVKEVEVSYIVDFNGGTELTRFPADLKSEPAPQSIVAESALKHLGEIDTSNWDAVFTRIIGEIAGQPRMDPVVRVMLLVKAMQVATGGSYGMESGYGPCLECLKKANVPMTVAWMKLDDSEAHTARSLAEIALKQLNEPAPARFSLAAAVKRAEEAIHAVRDRNDVRFVWIGWLRRADGNPETWQCRCPGPPPAVVAHLGVFLKEDAKITPHGVGGIIPWQGIVLEEPSSAFVEGRPVYMSIPAVTP